MEERERENSGALSSRSRPTINSFLPLKTLEILGGRKVYLRASLDRENAESARTKRGNETRGSRKLILESWKMLARVIRNPILTPDLSKANF